MVSTTVKSDGLGSVVAALYAAILGFLVNPFGWKRFGDIHLNAVKTSPNIPLFGSWYLEATREDVSADILLQVDRLGRRRCRIVNLNGLTKDEVRKTPAHVATTRWVVSGDDGLLKSVMA